MNLKAINGNFLLRVHNPNGLCGIHLINLRYVLFILLRVYFRIHVFFYISLNTPYNKKKKSKTNVVAFAGSEKNLLLFKLWTNADR